MGKQEESKKVKIVCLILILLFVFGCNKKTPVGPDFPLDSLSIDQNYTEADPINIEEYYLQSEGEQ